MRKQGAGIVSRGVRANSRGERNGGRSSPRDFRNQPSLVAVIPGTRTPRGGTLVLGAPKTSSSLSSSSFRHLRRIPMDH